MIAKLGLTGPLLELSKTVAGEVSVTFHDVMLDDQQWAFGQIQQQAMNRLREHFSQPVMEEPVGAKVVRASLMRPTNSTSTDRLEVDRDEDAFMPGRAPMGPF